MGSRDLSSDLDLARQAVAGKAAAWDAIIELYGGRIFSLALHFSSTREQAEDLTQDVFLRLFRNLSKYRGDVPLLAWTLRLSRNLCIDHYRQTRREREATFINEAALELAPSGDDPQLDAQRRELLAQVHATLREMREEEAIVIALRDLQGLSYLEIAALLDLRVGTLKSRLRRARLELIERLQKRHSSTGTQDATEAISERSLRVATC